MTNHSPPDLPAPTDDSLQRLELLVNSFHRLTGRRLIGPGHTDLWQACWTAPRVIVAHGSQADPLFFYGNQLALSVFELNFATFTQLPSRYSAESLLREERESLLARVHERGFIDDYSGVRVSATGRRFRIEQATVWNLLGADGRHHGQAATFEHWVYMADG
jgi:MEKHLA domain-containing protein